MVVQRLYSLVIPMRSSRLTLLACLVARIATAQVHVHFGVDAGVPLTDTLVPSESSSTSGLGSSYSSSFYRLNSETKRLLIGPVFRLDLSKSFGIEFDALYQRINQDSTNISISPGYSSSSFTQSTANRWQFPLLVQYRRRFLFVESGLSISHITSGHSVESNTTISNSSPSSSTSTYADAGSTSAGMVFGAGADFPAFHIHIRPEFRYTHLVLPDHGCHIRTLG